MRTIKITGKGLPKYQQQPGTVNGFQCPPGEVFDEALGQCVPDINYSAQTTPTTTAAPQYDVYGCQVGVTEWSVEDQKCVPIGQKAPQKFNLNSKLSTGTPKTGPGTGVNPQKKPGLFGFNINPYIDVATATVGVLSGIADKLQNANLQKRTEDAQKRFGMTDSRFGPMRNVYSYGRTPTGYAYNQMVPVQFKGAPAFEAMTVPQMGIPQFAQDGIEVVRDIMQLPTLYTGDPTAPGLYAEDPAIQAAMTRRYADIELPTAGSSREDVTGVLTSPTIGPAGLMVAPESGKIGEDMFLPLKPYSFRFSSGFGSRKAPKAGASSNHNGNDLGAASGDPIFSVKSGTVSKVWYGDKGGNQVIVKHDDGTSGGYAHLSKFGVKEGDRIAGGALVGYVGNTGISTGPHLHFTYRDANGNLVDPNTIFNFKTFTRDKKPKGYMDDFGYNATPKKEGQISFTHNNPLNIHYSDFTRQYNGTKGAADQGGFVTMFPDLNTGLQAAKDLLFAPTSNYVNLTISEARNRWVTGKANEPSSSTPHIVKAMGKDVKLADLTPAERDKLIKEFAKWEGRQAYNLIKNMRLYKEGGEYELSDDEIQQILANGGQIEFL